MKAITRVFSLEINHRVYQIHKEGGVVNRFLTAQSMGPITGVMRVTRLRVVVRENRQNVKNVNGRGSVELIHTNIVESLGGVISKYIKHKSFTTTFVLEI